MDILEKTYTVHSEHYGKGRQEHPEIQDSWFDQNTADSWRHRRMYEVVDILAPWHHGEWFTIGDGRFGLDSQMLRKKGVGKVVPSDISETLLKEACQRGVIDSYRVENAEKLSLDDESFDVVFGKECFHHFPRPFIALYEMLRAARKAVVMIEPVDKKQLWPVKAKEALKRRLLINPLSRKAINALSKGRLAKRGLRRGEYFVAGGYEIPGCHVYKISISEFTKVALSLDLPVMAFKRFNDFYLKGGELAPASWRSKAYLKIRLTILWRDLLHKLGLKDPNVVSMILFKEAPDEKMLDSLSRRGWSIYHLSRNPYHA